ncbi:LOW QUALITY PROTEIN: cytosolic carboxypeptidase 2 [Porphyrio hochstetteri]
MESGAHPAARLKEGALGEFGGGLLPKPYDSFMHGHLHHYGYFRGPKLGRQKSPEFLGGPSTQHPTEAPSTGRTGPSCLWGPGMELSHDMGPLPPPCWPVECEVIEETVEHIKWVPPEPESFCQATGCEGLPDTPSEEQDTVVYHLSPVPQGSCFTCTHTGGAPGPLSVLAAPLEGPQDTTLLFESCFESSNLQKAVKVGPYAHVLILRPDLYTAKHTQWFYFHIQNTQRDPLYCFTITNLVKPKSLYGEGMHPLLYSRDAQSHGRVGTNIRYYWGGGGEEPASFCLSWSMRFPHDGDTFFFAHSYPHTYSDLWALARDPVRLQYCAVQRLCRSLDNIIYLLTITSPTGAVAKQAVVLSTHTHPGSSWAMQGILGFILSAHEDAQLLRRLFVFKVVPMLNPDGVVVSNSRCSLAGRDPNRAYGTVLCSSFPGTWHLQAMVQRVLAEREVVLYCYFLRFHGHSWKNNVFMYSCDSANGTGLRLRQHVFPLMLSKNAPDKFSFSSCKFKVQKSKAGMGRVIMWHMGVSNSYTMEVAFSSSTLGRRSSHFTVEDLKSLGYHCCDTLLDFCPMPPRWDSSSSNCGTQARAIGVTPALFCGSSSACQRWTHCCSSAWAGSRNRATAGAMCPPRSSSPGRPRPRRPTEPHSCRGLESLVCPAAAALTAPRPTRRRPGRCSTGGRSGRGAGKRGMLRAGRVRRPGGTVPVSR